ncbi:hypothetical protein [Candidatus Albibeggiatoa sp. nov. NOAA]|uniref:hypothetical protein n=1 Tax=Candidatus Albibeggiatoa sp. nov. NOAA TaxID=3162724 RepID=UPI0032F5F713|nr:hypothetical protein [Thiotrichaceae bacterium]
MKAVLVGIIIVLCSILAIIGYFSFFYTKCTYDVYAVQVFDKETGKALDDVEITYNYNEEKYTGYSDSEGYYKTKICKKTLDPLVKLQAEKDNFKYYSRYISENLQRIEEVRLEKINEVKVPKQDVKHSNHNEEKTRIFIHTEEISATVAYIGDLNCNLENYKLNGSSRNVSVPALLSSGDVITISAQGCFMTIYTIENNGKNLRPYVLTYPTKYKVQISNDKSEDFLDRLMAFVSKWAAPVKTMEQEERQAGGL